MQCDVDASGQIEGIGTAPRFTAKNGAGEKLADEQLAGDVKDARSALAVLGSGCAQRFSGSARARRRPSRRSWRRALSSTHDRHAASGAGPARDSCRSPRSISRTISPRSKQSANVCPTCRRSHASTRAFIAARAPSRELVPLPREIREAGVQRYGFHGLSYEYIASALPRVAPDIAEGRVVVAHLGSGASLCALKARKSVDCTMGFTALDGLCMGTRPGAVDPGVILYLLQSLGMTAKDVETLLYKKSGLLGHLRHQQ